MRPFLRRPIEWFRQGSGLRKTAAVVGTVGAFSVAATQAVEGVGNAASAVAGLFEADEQEPPSGLPLKPGSPQEFAAQLITLFFSEPDRYWEQLNSEEKAIVSKLEYVRCLRNTAGLTDVKALEVHRGRVEHPPWSDRGTQVTKVGLATKLVGPDDKSRTANPVVYLLRERGRWTSLLKDYEWEAHFLGSDCPRYDLPPPDPDGRGDFGNPVAAEPTPGPLEQP